MRKKGDNKMTLLNDEIYGLYEALYELKEKNEISLPVTLAYQLVRNMQKLEPLYMAIEEARRNLFKVYVDENDIIPNDKINEVNQKLQELGMIKEELNLYLIKLKDISYINLPIDIVRKLMPIIKEDD